MEQAVAQLDEARRLIDGLCQRNYGNRLILRRNARISHVEDIPKLSWVFHGLGCKVDTGGGY
jgi:hypothetical protein